MQIDSRFVANNYITLLVILNLNLLVQPEVSEIRCCMINSNLCSAGLTNCPKVWVVTSILLCVQSVCIAPNG